MRSSNAYAIGWSNYSDLTRPHPKRWLDVREIPLFQGNLGWWNITIIWPELVVCPKICWWHATLNGKPIRSLSQPSKLEANALGSSGYAAWRVMKRKAAGNDTLGHQVVVAHIFYFHPYLGKIPNLTNIFQMGWNHQLVHTFRTFNWIYQRERCW